MCKRRGLDHIADAACTRRLIGQLLILLTVVSATSCVRLVGGAARAAGDGSQHDVADIAFVETATPPKAGSRSLTSSDANGGFCRRDHGTVSALFP
jgi:hypothetical protein